MFKEMEQTGPEITEDSIVGLESFLNKKLPGDYREFLLEYNGGEPIQRAINFNAPKLRTSGDYISTFYEVSDDVSYGIQPNIENHADLIPDSMIFIAISPAGNYFLLSLRDDSYGEIFYKDHEIEDESEFYPDIGLLPESMTKVTDKFKLLLDTLYDPDES